MKLTYTLLVCLFLASLGMNAQENQGAVYIGTADDHTYVPSLASRMNELTPSTVKPPKEAQDGRSYRIKREIVPGKGRQTDILSQEPHKLNQKIPGRTPDLVWVGATSNSQPTDPSLAVGPNHVLVVFNTGFAIYDKDGVELLGQTNPNPAIFPQSGCCDLTVSYDPVATSVGNPTPGRWVLSFLGGGAQVAVSDGPDPLTAGWNVYNINTINDYQKLSVWSDGYYVSDQANGNRIYAMERQAMLDGEPAGNVSIQGFSLPNFNNQGFASVQALNISDDNYPGPGNATVVFFQDDAYPGQTDDSIKFWDLDVDFDTPANSTISTPQEILVTPFTSIFDGTAFNNLTQPGGSDIDALQGIIMNQAQYKRFPTYESAIFNFVIDIAAGSAEQAAIRWYEFRRNSPTDPWTMEQEGTFSDPDGRHFWHGSMIMDSQGNIGMGFSALGNTSTGNGTANEFVSSYYTGRFASDPLGTMTIAPQLIAQGDGNIPGIRYGDYSKIDLDPVDYKRMYFINELMFPGRSDVVGRFQIAPDFNNDVGAIDIVTPVDGTLTNAETVEVTLFNFGLDPQSNFDVILSLDGTTIATETFTGTLAPTASASFTFAATLDLSTEGQTYEICVATDLAGDEDVNNDSTCKNVLHQFANDLGVTALIAPTSGAGLSNEDVTVTIENFGAAPQMDFDVTYQVNGGTLVTETVAGPIGPGATLDYTFTTQADLSAGGDFEFVSCTALASDAVTANDCNTTTVNNVLGCENETNDTNFPIGPDAGTVTNSGIDFTNSFVIEDVNVSVNIEHTWVGDLTIELIAPDNTTVLLADGVCGDCDDMVVTFDDEATDPITGATDPIVGTFQPEGSLADFNGLASNGDWTLRITDNANQDGGQLLDWTLQICGDEPLGLGEAFANTELKIINQGNDQFKLVMPTSEVTNTLLLTVTNMAGQRLFSYPLDNETNNGYEYNLDMSYVASGVYIIRLGDENNASVKRIIVE